MSSLGIFHKVVSIAIFLGTVFFIVKPLQIKIPRTKRYFPLGVTTVPLIGVIILLITLTLSPHNLLKAFLGDDRVKPWTILIIFNASAYTCISLDLTGIFKYIALKTTALAGTLYCFKDRLDLTQLFIGSSGYALFFAIYFLSSFLTLFTSNDIVILTVTPIICYYCKVSFKPAFRSNSAT